MARSRRVSGGISGGSSGGGTTYPQVAPGLALAGPPTGTATIEAGTTATSGTGWHAASRPAGAWAFGHATWTAHPTVIGFRPSCPSDSSVASAPGAGAGWWSGTKAAITWVRAGKIGLLVYDIVTEATDHESVYYDAPWPQIFVRLTAAAFEISGDGLVWIAMPWASRATIEALTGPLAAAGTISTIISSPTEQASNQVIHAA